MTRILELAPSLADRFYQEGVSYEELGALNEAMIAFQRAVQADSTHVDARLALAYHCRRLNRLTEAIAHCEAVLDSAPCAAAYFALGHMLVVKQEYGAALDALRRCLELDPQYEQARYQIAFIYYLRGEYDVAITEFHRVAQREPDWETLFFLGECYRMLRRSTEAERSFRRALALAGNWGQVELTRAQLRSCERLAEFPREQAMTIKDRAYCDCGVVYLGSSTDDGILIPPYLFYHFDYENVATTLRRFLRLSEGQGWQWDAVLPVDIVSLPLALALAQQLGVGTEPQAGKRTLIVQALGETVEGLQDATERLDQSQTFCLLSCWSEEWRADIVGLATPLVGSLPWYRPRAMSRLQLDLLGDDEEGGGARPWQDARRPDLIAADILAALAALPEESNQQAQIDYYNQHRQLRWRP